MSSRVEKHLFPIKTSAEEKFVLSVRPHSAHPGPDNRVLAGLARLRPQPGCGVVQCAVLCCGVVWNGVVQFSAVWTMERGDAQGSPGAEGKVTLPLPCCPCRGGVGGVGGLALRGVEA